MFVFSSESRLEAKAESDHDGGVVEMTVEVRDKKRLEETGGRHRRISACADVERFQLNVFQPIPNTSPFPSPRE